MLTGCYPFDDKSYANGAAAGKSNENLTENNAGSSESEVVKKEGDVTIKAEPLEVEGVPIDMGEEETNMVGVERLAGKIVYAKRKPPSYMMDWKPIVDIQAIRSKEGEGTSQDRFKILSHRANYRRCTFLTINRLSLPCLSIILVKELLNRMLEIDPSQRIRIQHVLQTDWICMIDEELKKLEVSDPSTSNRR